MSEHVISGKILVVHGEETGYIIYHNIRSNEKIGELTLENKSQKHLPQS